LSDVNWQRTEEAPIRSTPSITAIGVVTATRRSDDRGRRDQRVEREHRAESVALQNVVRASFMNIAAAADEHVQQSDCKR